MKDLEESFNLTSTKSRTCKCSITAGFLVKGLWLSIFNSRSQKVRVTMYSLRKYLGLTQHHFRAAFWSLWSQPNLPRRSPIQGIHLSKTTRWSHGLLSVTQMTPRKLRGAWVYSNSIMWPRVATKQHLHLNNKKQGQFTALQLHKILINI